MEKPIQPSLSTRNQLRSFDGAVRLFLSAVLIDGIVISAWSLFFNFYILERGFGREFLGLATAAPPLAVLILGMPVGMLADRLGSRRAMILGASIYVVACGLQVILDHPLLILSMAFLSGAANNLYYISQAPFMMRHSIPENRTLLFSLSFGLITLSGAVGNLFAGQLPALAGGWLGFDGHSARAYQIVLLGAVAFSTLTLVPLALIREPGHALRKPASPNSASSLRRILTRPDTLRLAMPNLLVGIGATILIPYLNVFLREKFSITDQTLGILFSLSSLLIGVGTFIGPYLAGKMGSKIRALVTTQGLSLVFLLLLGFGPGLWLASIGLLMRAMLMNMAVPLFDAFAMEHSLEQEQATINSVRNLAWQFGASIGPYISGVMQATVGFTPIFISTTILYGIASFLTWLFFCRNERQLGIPFGAAETASPTR